MATTVDTLLIDIKAETKGLNKGLTNVNKKLGETQSRANKLSAGLRGAAGVLASIGVAGALGGVVNTIRNFEDLEATLRAVTGGADEAAASFDLIRTFTKTTTFQIEEVAQSFITLLQAGVTPTADALQDFGNFAAGMGRSVEQLARATFNATTGEMEMLKQFGVIARQQGDQITVTFEGQTKIIERSGDAIVDYLRRIGRERFPTGLSERANTLSGAVSNLNDKISEFNVSIGEGGFKSSLTELTKNFGTLVEDLDPVAEALGGLLGTLIDVVNEAVKFIDALVVIGTVLKDPVKNVKLLVTAFDDGKLTMEDFRKVLTDTNESLEEQSKKVEDLLNDNDDLNEKLAEVGDAMAEIKEATIQSSMAFTKNFVDSLLASEKALQSFRNFAKDIVSQIITIFLQLEVVNRILNTVFSNANLPVGSGLFGDNNGGDAGGGVGGGGDDFVGPPVPVQPITDASRPITGQGTQAVQVIQNINFATGINATVRNEVIELLPQIADVTSTAISEKARRSTRFRGAFSG